MTNPAKNFIIAAALVVALNVLAILGADIREPESYGPKVVPSNVGSARRALGYDKFENPEVRSTTQKTYPFGNNWEQFDSPEIKYNFGGTGYNF